MSRTLFPSVRGEGPSCDRDHSPVVMREGTVSNETGGGGGQEVGGAA